MYKKNISVIITDLDNTLFDWVNIWYNSFKAMLERLVIDSGIPEEILISEIKNIYQKHGTSEYSFLIEELPSLIKKHPGEDLTLIYKDAIYEYRKARKVALKLYPSVIETLNTLKEFGCLIVGYTESMAFYSNYRVRNLGLDCIIDILYSPEDHDIPDNLTADQIRLYPMENYEFKITKHRYTPKGAYKPNTEILNKIINDINANKEETLYIGDSLIKDIYMAQQANVTDVYAKYGKAQNRDEYELLRKVTHWTKEQVEKEKHIDEVKIKPSYTLQCSFSELLNYFHFTPYLGKYSNRINNLLSYKIDIWKKTIDVQQHFNDLELRIRNYAITILGAILGATAIILNNPTINQKVRIYKIDIKITSLLIIIALFVWIAFYIMDRFWYHRLLYGAVKHGEKIENRLSSILPEITLTKDIRDESHIQIFGKSIKTTLKMDIFYCLITIGLIIILIIL